MDDILPGVVLPDFPMSPQERRGFIEEALKTDLPRFINAGASANQAFAAYQEAGMGINRARFLDIYRAERAYVETLGTVGQLPESETIDDAQRIVPSYRLEARYRERFAVTVYDSRTGDVRQTVYNFDHDEPLSIGEVTDIARSEFSEGSGPSSEMSILSMYLEESYIAGWAT